MQRHEWGNATMASALKIIDQLAYVHSMPQTNAADIATFLEIDRPSDSQTTLVGLICIVSPDDSQGQSIYAMTATPYDRTIEPGQGNDKKVPKKLLLICDTLTISCRWWLPECDVTVFARTLALQGTGCIDTSPLPWTRDKAQDGAGKQAGKDGASGRSAGDITVLVGEVVLPPGDTRRLIARGGNGQGGGHGVAGTDGRGSPSNQLDIRGTYTHTRSYEDSNVRTTVKAKLEKHSDHTIIGIRSKWNVAALFEYGDQTWGTLEFPTGGTDATAPGGSGNGGNGGKIYTNSKALLRLCDAASGRRGEQAPTVKGGRAGEPRKAAYYDNLYYHKWNVGGIFNHIENENSESAKTEVKTNEVHAGQEKSADPGKNGDATEPEEAKGSWTNTWLHPRIVPRVTDYIRRAYLSEQRDDARKTLAAYAPAFGEGFPARAKKTEWEPEDESYWIAIGTELGVLNQRLAAGLDYFGNPAGYTPLLSLASSFRMYKMELDTALEVLMFVLWITAKQRANRTVAEESRVAANLLTKENRTIVAQIADSERRNDELNQRIGDIEKAQNRIADRIGVLRTSLINKASNQADRIAQIKLAANLAAALLQVFPYGQPVLGGIASMAADATDLLDNPPEDVQENLKKKLKETVDAYKDAQKASKELVKEAKEKAKEFAKAEGKELTVDELKKLNKTADPAWKTAAKGAGAALTQLKAAYEKGQVTRAKIDAQFAKLAAEDPEWKKLTTEMSRLVDDKAKLVDDIMTISNAITQQFAALANNTAAVGRLDSTTQSAATRMLGTTGRKAVEEMSRRATLALTEALYNLVRAFESVRLEGVSVDWSIEAFIKELNQAIDEQSMDKWDDSKVQARIKTLRTAFTETLRTMRRKLAEGVKNLAATTAERDFVLDDGIGKDLMHDLNDGAWITIDTIDLDFVSPDRQHQLLVGIDPKAIAFVEPKEKLPTRGDLEILLEIDDIGIVRSGTSLFGLRMAAPLTITCTYHFGTGTFSKTIPSESSKDLLNIVLDDMTGQIKQRMALPSAWGAMRVKASYSGLRSQTAPTISSIGFKAFIDGEPVGRAERALYAVSRDGFTPLAAQGIDTNPFLSGYFVFSRAGTPVELSSGDATRPVRKWLVSKGGRSSEVTAPTLTLTMDLHTEVAADFGG
jgi:tape measure domain-containing protein